MGKNTRQNKGKITRDRNAEVRHHSWEGKKAKINGQKTLPP